MKWFVGAFGGIAMSIFLLYCERERAIVCSDDRAVTFNAAGEVQPLAARVPKFTRAGKFIFAALGRSDVSRTLMEGTVRLVAAHPRITLSELAGQLPSIQRDVFDRRPRRGTDESVPHELVETALIGYDSSVPRRGLRQAREAPT